MIESTYTSELTKDSQTYSRICEVGKFHYETLVINVNESGIYGFQMNSTVKIYGYIYENQFDPLNPSQNLLVEASYTCNMYEFQFIIHLTMDTTYELVMTTFDPHVQGPFSVCVLGPNNISINRTSKFFSIFLLIKKKKYRQSSETIPCSSKPEQMYHR